MFGWLKDRLARRANEKRGREIFDQAEGSDVERIAIVGLMMALEADRVVEVRKKLKPDAQMIFMMAFECCMMWATKVGLQKAMKSEEVKSAVLAMRRHLRKHGWYQKGAFEKIWGQMEKVMPMAFNKAPDGLPPFPVAEMLMAPTLAGYPLDPMIGASLEFGMWVSLMMNGLSEAAQFSAKGHRKPKPN
jgi:hypothetical protein